MEQSAPSIAILPARWRRPAQPRWHGGEVVAFPQTRRAAKRVAVIDPFPIERRLLTALIEAQGHAVHEVRDIADLLTTSARAAPDIIFVHICRERALREASALHDGLPPIVLIDPYSLGAGCIGPASEAGKFPTLRFPIGLCEVAAAIERNAR